MFLFFLYAMETVESLNAPFANAQFKMGTGNFISGEDGKPVEQFRPIDNKLIWPFSQPVTIPTTDNQLPFVVISSLKRSGRTGDYLINYVIQKQDGAYSAISSFLFKHSELKSDSAQSYDLKAFETELDPKQVLSVELLPGVLTEIAKKPDVKDQFISLLSKMKSKKTDWGTTIEFKLWTYADIPEEIRNNRSVSSEIANIINRMWLNDMQAVVDIYANLTTTESRDVADNFIRALPREFIHGTEYKSVALFDGLHQSILNGAIKVEESIKEPLFRIMTQDFRPGQYEYSHIEAQKKQDQQKKTEEIKRIQSEIAEQYNFLANIVGGFYGTGGKDLNYERYNIAVPQKLDEYDAKIEQTDNAGEKEYIKQKKEQLNTIWKRIVKLRSLEHTLQEKL